MKDGDRVRPFAVGRAGGFCCMTAAKGVGTFSLPPAAAGACGRRGGSDPADADRVSPRFALEAADLLAVDTAFGSELKERTVRINRDGLRSPAGGCGAIAAGAFAASSDWSIILCNDLASLSRLFCSSCIAAAITLAHFGWFFSCAHARASRPSCVRPSSARASISSLAQRWWPCIAAAINGVVPRRFGRSTAAFEARRV